VTDASLPHYDAAAEQARLLAILDRYWRAVLRALNALVVANFDLSPAEFRVDDNTTRRLLQRAATRVVRIDETTRQAIAAMLQTGQERGYNNWQLAHGVAADNYPGIEGLFKESWPGRAELVARTELQAAQAAAAVERYYATGLVDRVKIIDGCQWDDDCCTRNGTTVPIEQAPTLNHPRCTLTLLPVLRQGVAGPVVAPAAGQPALL
jgi:hypothetical protein